MIMMVATIKVTGNIYIEIELFGHNVVANQQQTRRLNDKTAPEE